MDNVKHYAERNAEDLGQVFMDHLMAMTAEKLHRKSAIAAELAYRDQRIAELEAQMEAQVEACDCEWLSAGRGATKRNTSNWRGRR